ncbi:MAG: hypothetical protein JW782_02585 [Candidatus Saganbacteria bacterium]|nr:hypothetical protein [Candidatus Saganbacteria bacterium]
MPVQRGNPKAAPVPSKIVLDNSSGARAVAIAPGSKCSVADLRLPGISYAISRSSDGELYYVGHERIGNILILMKTADKVVDCDSIRVSKNENGSIQVLLLPIKPPARPAVRTDKQPAVPSYQRKFDPAAAPTIVAVRPAEPSFARSDKAEEIVNGNYQGLMKELIGYNAELASGALSTIYLRLDPTGGELKFVSANPSGANIRLLFSKISDAMVIREAQAKPEIYDHNELLDILTATVRRTNQWIGEGLIMSLKDISCSGKDRGEEDEAFYRPIRELMQRFEEMRCRLLISRLEEFDR